jgi:hypothetical protein
VERIDVELEALLARITPAAFLERTLESSRALSAGCLDQMKFEESSCFPILNTGLPLSMFPLIERDLAQIISLS